MMKDKFLLLVLLCSFLFAAPAFSAPDPKGAFGFAWDDSAEVVKTKATSLKLNLLDDRTDKAKGDRLLVFAGEAVGHNGMFMLRCYKDKLYSVAVTMRDTPSFTKYDEELNDMTKKYGKPSEHKDAKELTMTSWRAGETTVSVGKFTSKNKETGETEYITSSLHIKMSVANVVNRAGKK